ncbi:HesB/IscA family protein [Salmonirosea aquatica]|uniref:Iron-sulfur cluster assembly accessory protein n=1 Tax=Salmonirosea aquatica TaxID=2654236 RepID=A0A7C9FNS1_9BACT|nr:iron-sulfur cluster assembly accessory protein [Cytophagaceae bacterium SJW1-29]
MKDKSLDENTVPESPVHISARARAEIMDTFTANKIPDAYGLRVGLRGGACSATYLLGFDTATPHDQEYDVEGIRVIIDRRHLMYVLGAAVDYEENPQEQGFTINMPPREDLNDKVFSDTKDLQKND